MVTVLTKAYAKALSVKSGFNPDTFKPAEQPQSSDNQPLFQNSFKIEDLQVFDDATIREIVDKGAFGLQVSDLALSVHGADTSVIERLSKSLSLRQRIAFRQALHRPASVREVETVRQRILDSLFWELTYWKTPELYEELTEGEKLHPGIFKALGPSLRGKTVLDAGAGSGRAAFECMSKGAKQVYAVEPSPGLLNILEGKLSHQPYGQRIVPLRGRFDNLPLDNNSVDVTISCSAFTAADEQGGEPGLAELQRVTRPGGQIVIIWPRQQDHAWLETHGFQYRALPMAQEMTVNFRSLDSAKRCARRFYARNRAVLEYLLRRQTPEVPFSVLGFNPPNDYCWQEV